MLGSSSSSRSPSLRIHAGASLILSSLPSKTRLTSSTMDCIESRNTAAPDYLTRLLETTKPPVQVLLNIFYVFQAHRQPDQIIGSTGLVSLLRAQPTGGGGGRGSDGGCGIRQ